MAERDRLALRYVGPGPEAGRIVYKRSKRWPREVAPVENLSSYICRTHGELKVDPVDLAAFVRDTISDTATDTATYWVL